MNLWALPAPSVPAGVEPLTLLDWFVRLEMPLSVAEMARTLMQQAGRWMDAEELAGRCRQTGFQLLARRVLSLCRYLDPIDTAIAAMALAATAVHSGRGREVLFLMVGAWMAPRP